MRVALEKVNGVYQGVVFPFREGFMSGVFRQVWGKDGSMYVGQTSRGWGATGRAQYGLQRLVWTGKVPFEPHHVSARPDGFEIFFTAPVDRAAAENPASYAVNSFIYKYHHIYGSPPINQLGHACEPPSSSKDGMSARLVVDSLRQGYIHEIRMTGVKSASGESLLHDFGYYTVNQIPAGKALAVKPAANVTQSAMPASGRRRARRRRARPLGARRALAKHQTTMPAEWNGTVDQTVSVQGVEGLKFSLPAFEVKPGARVKLDFANTSDMLHNLVIVRPGTATTVGEAGDAPRTGRAEARLRAALGRRAVSHRAARAAEGRSRSTSSRRRRRASTRTCAPSRGTTSPCKARCAWDAEAVSPLTPTRIADHGDVKVGPPPARRPNASRFRFSTVSFMLLPASVAAPCALLFTRFFSALMSLPAFFDVLLMSRATLFRPPGCFDCEPLIPVVFLRTVLVSLPASFNLPCALLASRLISAFVSRPAFFESC